jgi:acyl-CoA synthetase (AMP-forming)/AMP-acid ligase II
MRGLHVGELVRSAALATPARPAASIDNDVMTFAQLDMSANQVAHHLRSLGIGHRDTVAWWGDTTLLSAPLFVAAARLGAVFAPVNARLGAAEASGVLALAGARLTVVDSEQRCTQVDGAVRLDELIAASGPAPSTDAAEPALREDDRHVVFFTSGSTGRPKGVVLSHRASCLRSFVGLQAGVPGATVCMFPQFHMAAWTIALGCWQGRQEIVFVTTPTAEVLLDAVERRRATRLYAIPAVWARVLTHGLTRHDVSTLREADTGTSATPPELLAAIKDALPHTVTRVFYGSTEAGPATMLIDADIARKPGSVGVAAPGVEVRLGRDGEVLVRSPFLMDGYLDDPDATAAAITDGWYHTGDAGAIDDEGYFSIVGRLRDVIRTGGETVSPVEVEDALRDHALIVDVAVVGVPDAEWGEIVCAVVVPSAAAYDALDVDTLRAHCTGRLASFKHPRRVVLADEIPRTPATGQVQRALLIERIATGG